MNDIEIVVYGVVTLFTAILSGIGGAGGGFITTPLAIFLGLTPQQAIATGKLGGLSISIGSLHRLHKAKLHNWKIVIPIMILAGVIGLVAPFLITEIDNEAYRKILGGLLILMIPVLFVGKIGQSKKDASTMSKVVGYVLLALALLMQAVFSSGMGTLVNLALMVFLGMTALEANVTKRYSQVVLNTLIVLGLIGTGLIVWKVVTISVVTGFIGGQIGSRIALKHGDKFVMIIFAVLMFLSGMELLFG